MKLAVDGMQNVKVTGQGRGNVFCPSALRIEDKAARWNHGTLCVCVCVDKELKFKKPFFSERTIQNYKTITAALPVCLSTTKTIEYCTIVKVIVLFFLWRCSLRISCFVNGRPSVRPETFRFVSSDQWRKFWSNYFSKNCFDFFFLSRHRARTLSHCDFCMSSVF
jgi:hypothetical protein